MDAVVTSSAPPQYKNRLGIDARPCAEDHRKVDKLLHAVCHWFHRRNPQHHYEDLYSIACEAWADARASFNPYRKSKLGTWIWNRIRYALLSHNSKLGRDGARCRDFSNLEDVTCKMDSEGLPCGAGAGPEMIPDKVKFDAEKYLTGLSSDAAEVVRTVWDLVPAGVDLEQLGPPKAKGLLAAALKELEWARERFMAAVTEVREQLP